MILYRAMSWLELAKYLFNIKLSPLPSLPSKNSWKKNVLCFFGTANNAVHWAAPGTHDVPYKVNSFKNGPKIKVLPGYDDLIKE